MKEEGKAAGDKGSPPETPRSEGKSEQESESSAISPHYDASKDVVTRMEFLTERQMRAVVLSIWGAVFVGLGLLAMGLDFKLDMDHDYFLTDQTVPIINLAFAAVLVAGLLATWLMYVRRITRANSTGKRWSMRRKKGVTLAVSELTLQLVNAIFFLIPNAYVLARKCSWFGSVVLWSGFVRWTCWNSIFLLFWVQAHNTHPALPRWARYVNRPDASLMDAPWWVHWPKLSMWCSFEGVLLGLTLYLQTHQMHPGPAPPGGDCTQMVYNCTFRGPALGLVIATQACIVLYAAGYLLLIRRSFQILNNLPYKQFRIANFMVRLQVRLRVLAFLFFVLSSVIYFFVHINTCSSFIQSWLGFLSSQFVQSCIAAANAFIFMPKRPHSTGILQVWLQEFAWTERDVPRKRRERSSSLPQESFELFCMDCEPMFCFETSIKMLYWSFLVYDYMETPGSPFNSDTALSLYELEHFELFWEKTLDTKAIVGWSNDTVVIAFRGTASLANVKADIQAWRTPYPAGMGSPLLCSAPMVHRGFLAAWTANGFNDRLIGRLEHIIYRCSCKETGETGMVKVFVTGHSLGGALATLCAYDIIKRCPDVQYTTQVKCYTFGAPRTGNHVFARLYNQAIPDTWHIINNDDAVTRGGKFVKLYKRPGHRVLINKRGDMVVRPSFVEASIRQVPGAGSIRDHFLTQYQKAMVAVVTAQFGRKSYDDGKTGVLSLAQEHGTREALQVAGLAVDELREWAENGLHKVGKIAPTGSKLRQLLSLCRPRSARQGVGEVEEEGGGEASLQAVVVEKPGPARMGSAGDVHGAAAGRAATIEAGAPEESGGIMHQQCRRVCQAKKTCNTVCQLAARASKGRRGRRAPMGPASPMCDMPDSSARSGSDYDPETAAANMAQVVMHLEPQPSIPDSPHLPSSSTRGDVAEVPRFQLVLDPPDTPRSTHMSPGPSLELVEEGEGEGEGGEAAGEAAVAPRPAVMEGGRRQARQQRGAQPGGEDVG